jgi:hypothetical protein
LPFPPFPSVPGPSTWEDGPVLVSELRGDVTNAAEFLSQRPFFLGQTNAGSGWASGSDFGLGLPVEIVDTWNMHNTGSDSSQLWCQAPGWYLCKSMVPFNYTGGTQYLFAAGFIACTGGVTGGAVRGGLQLCGSGHGGTGDYIQPTALQDTGGSINLQNAATQQPTVSARWVAAASGTASLPVPANPAWPVPPSYVTSAFLNAGIRDTIRFLCYPPVFRAHYAPGSTTLPSTTFPSGARIQLNTIDVDNYGGGATGTSTGYTAPVAGVYFCWSQFNLAFNANATGYCAGFSVNGGTVQWGDAVYKLADTTGGGASACKRLRLNAGDTVAPYGCQGTGGSISYNGSAANQTRMVVVWESA